ncbi:lyase family protein [Streptomyces sp. NPDC057011]|uniref:lyase family protein n=1 Tax=unclassified Streptomyces TaxID=2593676 RepID=UPI003634878A
MTAFDGFDGGPDTGLLSPVRAATPVEEAVGDRAWLQAMLDAEAALARAQARLGTVPASAAEAITAAARADRFDIRALAVSARETANPVVGLVQALTARVAAEDPTAAEYVHRGSTSQDVLDTGAMLVCAGALDLIAADLLRTAEALAALAEQHATTVMAARTLALHAVPTTFGLKAAGWRQLVLEAETRITTVRASLPVSLGGAAGTLAGYLEHATPPPTEAPARRSAEPHPAPPAFEARGPGRSPGAADRPLPHPRARQGTVAAPPPPDAPGAYPNPPQPSAKDYADRLADAFAAETGLARPTLPWHALRAPIADLAAALAFTTGALGKLAVDVQVLVRTEIAEATEPAVAGRGGSSAMPHKRNPVLSTLIRSAALQVPALAAGLTQCLVTEDERSAGVWHAEWLLLRECMRLAGGAAWTAAELAEGLTPHPERMLRNLALTGSQVATERLAAALAPRLGKAHAKDLLSEASATADRENRPLPHVLRELPDISRHFTDRELTDLLDPTTYTGAAEALVSRALAPRTPPQATPRPAKPKDS